MKLLLCLFFTCTAFLTTHAVTKSRTIVYLDSSGLVIGSEDTVWQETQHFQENSISSGRPHPLFERLKKKQRLNKKITAAVLAFPFPFGIVGLHRIYMGTKPYVPVVYIATAGGVFGILPFIDFCVLMFDKDFDRYKDNGKVFMWVKD
ncbi:MAG: TM2 domain-containing protein [Bacteroidetes bacterium]|nr:TM2 domain-containing protein [Bacteroidota bacterium]